MPIPFSNHPQVEFVPPGTLHPSPTHARKHSERQVEQIATSFDRFGFVVPVLAEDDGQIVSGVGRWMAAQKRKLDTVPVLRVRFLSDVDRRAFALAENRLAELSSWDPDLLKGELDYLFENSFDIATTGFSMSDLDLGVIEDALAEEPAFELPDPKTQAVSRIGDLWSFGDRHKLLCGNARDAASYERLLGDERAAMGFVDPPYNVKIQGHVSGLGRVKHREFFEASGEKSRPQFTAFLRSLMKQLTCFSADGSIHCICMDWRHMREILDAADGVYTEFKQLAVWAKTSGSMGAFLRSRHELIFIFKNGRARHINNVGLKGKGARYRTNVWEHAGANVFRKGRKSDLESHSTVKPVGLVADAILDFSNRGDIILDCCLGSGTTLLAAHRTHRRGFGIEIDELYCDTAIKRLTKMSGLVARLDDGRDFDTVAAERSRERETSNG